MRLATRAARTAPHIPHSATRWTTTSRLAHAHAAALTASAASAADRRAPLPRATATMHSAAAAPPPVSVAAATSSVATASASTADGAFATRIWTVDPSSPAAALEAALAEPAALLREGQLVAFPTETVYGLGGNALSSEALAGIYVAKGRPSDNPLIVHVHSHEQFLSLGRNIPRLALRLADRFWPGPLTLIIPTALGEGAASSAARAGLDCVGVRMPNHPVALALLRACGVPLAAPSANLSGRPSPTTAAHVATDLMGRVAGIVDGGASEGVGLESTVVECEDAADGADGGGWVTILRPGGITREMLEEVAGVGRVRIDPAIAVQEVQLDQTAAPVQALPKQSAKRGTERADLSSLLGSPSPCPCPSPAASVSASVSPVAASPSVSASASASGASASASPSPGPKAPGMKYTHYAPRAPLLLVDGDGDDQGGASLLLRTADSYLSRGDVVGVLATEELRPRIEQWRAAKGYSDAQLQLLVCGRRADLATVARGLYAALRAFDDTHVQIIVSEMFPADGGMGEAIMNRLHKAAGGKIVREDAAAAASATTPAVAQQ